MIQQKINTISRPAIFMTQLGFNVCLDIMEAPCQKSLIWSSWDQLKIYVANSSQRPFYHDIKIDPAMFFSVQFSAENWLQKSRKFSKFFIPICYFFYVTLLFTYPFPLIWRKFFKCSVLFLFFQLTIHIFLLFFKLLSFRGPILAEIKTLTDFKTE